MPEFRLRDPEHTAASPNKLSGNDRERRLGVSVVVSLESVADRCSNCMWFFFA